MKTIKHLFTTLLLLCTTVASAHDFEVEGIYYTITDATNKTVEVTYRGSYYNSYDNEYTGSVVIPESVTYDGTTYSVTSIGEIAFRGCTGLTSITIPNSVTSIEHDAFAYCTGLTSITIPNSVTSIENYAFLGCKELTSITIPNSVTSIGNHAFDGCKGLTSITIPNSVTSIGNYAFLGCTGLTSITIPNSVTSIGNNAFDGCTGLTSITIPNSVTSIESYAFYYCTGLTSVVIPNSVTSIEDYAFYYCSGLTSIEIPNSVTSIGKRAFRGCSGLTSIVIGNSVTSIGNYAFEDCTGLKTVINFSNLTFSKGSSYNGYVAGYADKVYNAPSGSIEGDFIFGKPTGVNTLVCYLGNATELTLPADYKGENYAIGEKAFNNCTELTRVEICNGVTSIGNQAFYGCTGLKEVHISDIAAWCNIAFASADANPLYYAKNLYLNGELVTDITIPNSVTSIEAYAFYNCTGLTSITIPNSVTSIGENAFTGCTGLKTIYNFSNITFSKGSSDNGYIAYYADKVYNVPNGFIEGDFIFGKPNDVNTLVGYLGNATELTLPADYKGDNYVIGADAFKGNKTITSITIHNGVKCIDEYAFSDCTSLKDVKIGDRAVSVERYAFSGCSSLENLRIGDGMKSIEEYAFYNCANLKEIVLGKRINYIGNNAFASSDKIESIYALPTRAINCENATTAFHQNACKYATLYVKESSIDSYETTEPWSKFYIEPIGNFTLTYMVDGEVYKKEKYEYDSAITPLALPEKEGHTFSGWCEIPETMPAEDITVTGSFSVNSYDVTFVVDGEVYKTVPVNYGEAITLPEEPSKEGHTFGGWSEIPETMPAQDVVIEGSFVVNSYNLIYIVDDEEYKRESVAYGTAITLSEEPTKEGHTFSGWSEVPATMPAKDISVVGSFSVNSYNATFVIDGEVYKTIPINYGETIPMPEEPVKDGCTFSGWSEIPATMPAEDITITGSFYANYYTLTYMVDGEVYATVSVGYNAVIPEMEEPTKEGHTFSGWENVPETMPAQDITIIGSFTVNSYNAIFLVDNALYAMLSVNYGEAIELPEPPSKEGFVFDGWDGLPVTMPAKDIVLIAIFTDVTGVDDVKSEIGKVKTIYDFQGRKVDTTNKGIYIINGKKVFVK